MMGGGYGGGRGVHGGIQQQASLLEIKDFPCAGRSLKKAWDSPTGGTFEVQLVRY